jgi:hypothetical protein
MTDAGKGLRAARQAVAGAPPAKLLLAWPRTAYTADSISRPFLGGQRHPQMPTRLTTSGLVASVLMDELALAYMPSFGTGHDAAELERISKDTDVAIALFETNGWLTDPVRYHRTPPPPERPVLRPRWFGPIRYEELTFESGYEAVAGMPGAERWAAIASNARAYAYVLRHRGEPRPWLVSLHGLYVGKPADLVAMRALHWFRARGFNVIFPVAPLHGPRASGRRSGAGMITVDYVTNVHAFSQAVWDIRRSLAWVREQGASSITVHGVSMGGFLAAIVAGIDNGIDRVIAGSPLVELGNVPARAPKQVRQQLDGYGLTGARAEAVHRVVSPLALLCKVRHDARFIYAGVGDRFTRAGEAYRLWRHWEEPTVLWFSGSHTADWTGEKDAFLERTIGSVNACP